MKQIKRNLMIVGMGMLLVGGFSLFSKNTYAACTPDTESPHNEGWCYTGASSSTGGCFVRQCNIAYSGSADINRTEGEDEADKGILYLNETKDEGIEINNTDAGEENTDVSINVHPVVDRAGAGTFVGRILDTLFSTVQDFYKGIFSTIGGFFGAEVDPVPGAVERNVKVSCSGGGSVVVTNVPEGVTLNASYWCERGGGSWLLSPVSDPEGGTGSSLEGARRKDLYCDVSASASVEKQKQEIIACVEASSLDPEEKEAVILKLK